MGQFKEGASWRDTARAPMLGPVNAIVFFPMMLFLVFARWATFVFLLIVIAALMVLDFYGFNPSIFTRYLRSAIAGRRRQATPWWM